MVLWAAADIDINVRTTKPAKMEVANLALVIASPSSSSWY
jgi:hypothetical protein